MARTTRRSEAGAAASFLELASPLAESVIAQAREIASEPCAEGFHQLRVSMRSLQSLWWFYRPMMDAREYARQRSIFQSVAGAAGRVRDHDILLALLNLRMKDTALPASQISAARQAAVEDVKDQLSPSALQPLLQEILRQASTSVAAGQQKETLKAFAEIRVAKAEKLLRKRLQQALVAKKADLAAFHDVRKAGKKARCLLELLAPALSGDQRKTLRRLRQTLKSLGELNDVVASEKLLRENPLLWPSKNSKPAKIGHWLEKERKRRASASAQLLRKKWAKTLR